MTFVTSLARWTSGQTQGLADGIVATQELRDGVCRIELHLDPERETTPFSQLPELSMLSARPGETATRGRVPMRWSSADMLVGEIPLSGSDTLLATVAAPGLGQMTLAPVCLPYSPEYRPRGSGRGEEALEQLARSTGGRARLNLTDIWEAIPQTPRLISLTPYLALIAVAIFLLEIVERRTALLSPRWLHAGLQRPVVATRLRIASIFRRSGRRRRARHPEFQSPADEPSSATPTEASLASAKHDEGTDDAMLDALTDAQQRARRRTGRN